MTELELLQLASWGDCHGQPSTQKMAVALAEFLRALNYHQAAILCDTIAAREDYFDE